MASPSIDPVGNPSKGHGTAQVGGTASGVASVTSNAFNTWNPNDDVLVAVGWSNAGGTVRTVSSVTVNGVGGPGANAPYTVNLRKAFTPAGGRSAGLSLYWIPLLLQEQTAGGITFTATMSGTCDHVNIVAIGYTGCFNYLAPFDSNAAVPATITGSSAIGSFSGPTYSTSQADDTLIAIGSGGFTAAFGAGNIAVTGYTSEGTASNAAGTDWSGLNFLDKATAATHSGIAETVVINANGGGAGAPVLIIQDALTADNNAGGSTETVAVNLAIAKMALSAQEGHQENAAVNLAIGHPNFAAAASAATNVTANLAIAKMGLQVNVLDLSGVAKLRQFNTFG